MTQRNGTTSQGTFYSCASQYQTTIKFLFRWIILCESISIQQTFHNGFVKAGDRKNREKVYKANNFFFFFALATFVSLDCKCYMYRNDTWGLLVSRPRVEV